MAKKIGTAPFLEQNFRAVVCLLAYIEDLRHRYNL